MASVVANSYKHHMFKGSFNLQTVSDVKMMLLETIATGPDNPDLDFVDDIAADEFSDTGYTGGFGGAGRKALATRAATVNNTDDRSEFDFDNIVWSGLGGTNSVVMCEIVREITNDAASDLISAHDVTNTGTDGTDYTLTIGTTGAIHIT